MYKTLSKDGKSKFCGRCKKFVLLTDYHKSTKYKAGVQSKCKSCSKEMADEYKPKRKLWLKRYMAKNGEKILSYKRDWRRGLKEKIFDKHGRVCKHCGVKDIRVLQIDHVNGDGYKERTASKNNWGEYLIHILKDETNSYQILCANCNWIKRIENGELKKNT